MEIVDLFVGVSPIGNRRAPRGEERRLLCGRPAGGGRLHRREDVFREGRLFRGAGFGGNGEAVAAEVVVLVVVAVVAAVVHAEDEVDDRAAGEGDVGLGLEHDGVRLVPSAGPVVEAPGRLVLAIERIRNGPEHALLVALVLVDRRQGRLRHVHVGDGLGQLDLGAFLRIAERGHLHVELGQPGRAVDGTAGAAPGKVVVVQQVEAERADLGHLVGRAPARTRFRGRVSLRQDGAVLLQEVALGFLALMFHRGRFPLRLRGQRGVGPRVHLRFPIRRAVLQVGFQLVDLAAKFIGLHLLRRHEDDGGGFVVVVDEGEEPVVVLLRDGVELVVVALRALDREAEHAFADGVHAVEHRLHAELLGIDRAFLVDLGIAEEARGDAFILAGLGQLVARDLLDDELVVGQVAVEGVDDPVAVEPDETRLVLLVAVGVGVARRIEPMTRPPFAVVRAREQRIHQTWIGVGTLVGQERVDLLRCGRQAEKIQIEPTDQRGLVGFDGGFESFLLQAGEDETVHFVAGPFRAFD